MQSFSSLRTTLLTSVLVLAPIVGCGAPSAAQARATTSPTPPSSATAQVQSSRATNVQAQTPAIVTPTPTPVARTYTKPSDAVLRQKLTPLQYAVTQNADTETPFQNQYWDNHAAGIYVDIVSGEPLFSSKDKFHSGTGWPSFTRPLEPKNIHQDTDTKLGFERTEIRSAHANSHLGHLFHDGPQPTGLRYCMNSAALRFVPASQLTAEGYGQYGSLFK